MIRSYFKMLAYNFLIFLCICLVSGHDRKISSKLNPGCDDCNSKDITLVYVKAEGSNDTIHQIWDFTRGIPTIIFTIGNVDSNLTVLWDKIKGTPYPAHFVMDEMKYSFAMYFDSLLEYNDLSDVGQYDIRNCSSRRYDLRHLTWIRDSLFMNENEVRLEAHANRYRTAENQWRDGVFRFKLSILPYTDYAVELPHLIHTANSTLIDVSLVNMTTTPEYNSSRFAYHSVMIGTDPENLDMHSMMRKTLDDEHTPGIFEIIELETPESFTNNDGGFVQFRPVSYNKKERAVASSTLVHVSQFQEENLPRSSTVMNFYKTFDQNNLLVEGLYVSFGETGDGFYKQHNYTEWSFTIGYGAPPVENFSLFVILVISIGLGIPVLLAFSGILYLMTKKCRQNPRTRLHNED